MGFFDLFGKGGGRRGEKGESGKGNPAAKFAERAADKRAQNYDRQEAIQAWPRWAPPRRRRRC